MTVAEFTWLCAFLHSRSGLALTPEKRYLLEGRLVAVCRKHGVPDLSALVRRLMSGDERLATATVEAMTTNETLFFRDTFPFHQFRDFILPTLREARRAERVIRIWCAAASSGQEPYSLAMIIDEQRPLFPGWRFDILATDISTEMVGRGRAGLYSQFEVQRGLPARLLLKHFARDGERWRLSDRIRQMVSFQTHNLIGPAHPTGKFDLIFCRNTLIYFDLETRRAVLESLHRQLTSDGFLMLGATETANGISDRFLDDPTRRGLYRNTASLPRAARPEAPARPLAATEAAMRTRTASLDQPRRSAMPPAAGLTVRA